MTAASLGAGRPLASLDLGSNTFRLLLGYATPRGFRVTRSRRETTRLAAGLDAAGRLAGGARSAALKVIASYIDDVLASGAEWVVAVGTGALRDARDGRRFAREVRRTTGLAVNIIDQGTEAALTLRGVELVMGERVPLAAVDIGGRSTEVVIRRPDGTVETHGLPLGAVTVTERHPAAGPHGAGDLRGMAEEVRDILARSSLPSALPSGTALVGTGGTFTTLAALDQGLTEYDPARINRQRLGRRRVAELLARLARLDEGRRSALPGMEPGRADIILAGAVVVGALLERFGREYAVVSDSGILEGTLVAGMTGQPPLELTPADALRAARGT